MEINWTVVTYLAVGFFALTGFYKGWWKEAITTGFLVLLVFLLQQPGVAGNVIDFLNNLLLRIWELLPDSLVSILRDLFESLGIRTVSSGAVQANPSSPATWLLVLLLLLAVAVLISRYSLPDYGEGRGYAVRPTGGLLGAILGGFNGFIIVNLVREYLDGRNLPGGGTTPPTEISAVGGSIGIASSDVSVRAVQLPSTTILDSFLPWVIIAVGIIVVIMALKTRIGLPKSSKGFRRIDFKEPYGYKRYGQ
jgi:hypothetical protein